MPNSDSDHDRNRRVIQELRANGGRVERSDGGLPLRYLILHTTGAKTKQAREHPLAYQPVGDNFAVFASYGASPTNPQWYHNLLAEPDAQIEVGTEIIDVRGRVLEGEERERIWAEQKAYSPTFGEYEKMTARTIPVVILERRPKP